MSGSETSCCREWTSPRRVGVLIRASATDVWPWLVQFGLEGFYSYELLERIGGIHARNIERLLPELQTLVVGQEIKLHPPHPG